MFTRCEQFYRWHFNGLGYRLIKSPGVDDLISKKSLRYLTRLNGDKTVQTLCPENVVAITKVKKGEDEYGRETVLNHTILISIY